MSEKHEFASTRVGAALLATLLCAACATRMETFLQTEHRANYSIQDQELKQLQFYISLEVLAKNVADEGAAESVIVVPVGTPGVVTEVGPDWLRVSFTEDSAGVYFLALKTAGGDSVYWLATKAESSSALIAVKDQDRKLIRSPLGEYELIYGDRARLLVDSNDLEQLIATRTHVVGRERK